MPCAERTVLFGAFDRHNLGDLLIAEVVASMLNHPCIFAGLVERDMTPFGGHMVTGISSLAFEPDSSTRLFQCGGEILTCSNSDAAIMLLDEEEAKRAAAWLEHHPEAGTEFSRSICGCDSLAPYVLSKRNFREETRLIFHAAGGADLDLAETALREEVYAKLSFADYVSVRDHVTQEHLRKAGIFSRLTPDPAVMTKELFADRIHFAEFDEIMEKFPGGYLSIQFSADFGDDRTLDILARELDLISRSTGLGIVLFRAGAAPWHDDPACYRRLCSKMKPAPMIFEILDIWKICGLIARSRLFCGSSLHGRIIANSFLIPAISLVRQESPKKIGAYFETWEGKPGTFSAQEIASGILEMLNETPAPCPTSIYRNEFTHALSACH
ncbi:MAG: polysaccharide pyruvyl transferase family protein [Burkholderiales bacterium]|nr:polysaccharide pyruvyl transferase family protein [Burkholderiales bacterium]